MIKAQSKVIPVGNISEEILMSLAETLTEKFKSRFIVAERIPLPDSAFDKRRNQYDASIILDLLHNVKTGWKLIGVTDKDLYSDDMNFIFGQAHLDEKFCLISTARLHASSDELFLKRIVKEAVHEIGHTMGLRHCPNPACVMHFSNTLNDTDKKEADYCEICREKIRL